MYYGLRIPGLEEQAAYLVLHTTILETMQLAEKLQTRCSRQDENFTHQVLTASRLYF